MKKTLILPRGLYPKDIRKKASAAWANINKRCYDEKNKRYSCYGGKGIKVNLDKKQFLIWYCNELLKWNTEKGVASVGRIDHSRNYSIDNIQIQSHSENTREMALRNSKILEKNFEKAKEKNKRKILIRDFTSNEPIMICESMSEASKLTGAKIPNIWAICNKKKKPRSLCAGKYITEYFCEL